MVRVNGLDECRDIASPFGDCGRCAIARAGTIGSEVQRPERSVEKQNIYSPSASFAPRLVCKLPAQDRGLVLVASNECLDVGLERSLVHDISTSHIIIYAECLR